MTTEPKSTTRVEIRLEPDEYRLFVRAMVYAWLKNGLDEIGQKVVPGVKTLGETDTISIKFLIASTLEEILPAYKEGLTRRSEEK